MKESVTYQAIVEQGVEKGRQEGRQEGWNEAVVALLIKPGVRRFGPPDAAIQNALAQITDPERLSRLADRLRDAADWHDLLATP